MNIGHSASTGSGGVLAARAQPELAVGRAASAARPRGDREAGGPARAAHAACPWPRASRSCAHTSRGRIAISWPVWRTTTTALDGGLGGRQRPRGGRAQRGLLGGRQRAVRCQRRPSSRMTSPRSTVISPCSAAVPPRRSARPPAAPPRRARAGPRRVRRRAAGACRARDR